MKKTTRNYIRLLIANGLLLVVVGVFWQYRINSPAFAESDSAVYTRLPSAMFLNNMKEMTDLADIKGQWVLLNIWGSWCPPCLAEMPSLEQLSKSRSDLKVMGIAVEWTDSEADVLAMMDRLKIPGFARSWDKDTSVYKALMIQTLPMTYLIDPQGRIRDVIDVPRDWMSPEIQTWLDGFIKASPSVPAQS